MSGTGAPAFTAMPMGDSARSTFEPATTTPSRIRPSRAEPTMISTSSGSPRARRWGMASGVVPMEGPGSVVTRSPLCVSKAGSSAP